VIVDHGNWRAWELFTDCHTQWHVAAGMTIVRMGVNYGCLIAIMDMQGIKRRKRTKLFAALQLIERGALAGLNEVDISKLLDKSLQELLGFVAE
jgi:hypothetical protein